MALHDLTEPTAVLAAISEYDALGQAAFLKRYGFRRARDYILRHDGREYDSKAIAGVAHGIQHPSVGPLKAAAFSGGADAAARRLRALGFEVEKGRVRNPNWTTDELLLALDLYFRHRPTLLDDSHPEVIELSEILNSLPIGGDDRGDDYRNPNGVHLKLANFASLDPQYPGVGQTNGGKRTQEVWNRWRDDPDEVARLAAAIRTQVATDGLVQAVAHEEEGEDEAEEGAVLFRRHRVRERDRRLRRKKIDEAVRLHGRLICEVCGVHLPDIYGAAADGIIDVHHVMPLSHVGASTTRLKDLAVVCPNCHRVLHRTRPHSTPAELRALLRRR